MTAHGQPVYADASLRALDLTRQDLHPECMRQRIVARSRARRYAQEPIPLEGRDVIVCDDGLATGVTARAALREIREERPRTLVFAAPVCAPGAVGTPHTADRIECLARPEPFRAVGQFYVDFQQTTDDEVCALLDAAERELARHRR